MIIKIPFKTPSINMMYSNWGGRRAKSKEAKLATEKIAEVMKGVEIEEIQGELKVKIIIRSKWYNLDGTIKKRDIVNLEKCITDSIFACLPNMDDKQITEITLKKIHDVDEEYALVKIEALE